MNNIINGQYMTLISSNNQLDITNLESALSQFKADIIAIVDAHTHIVSTMRMFNELIVELESQEERTRYQKKVEKSYC